MIIFRNDWNLLANFILCLKLTLEAFVFVTVKHSLILKFSNFLFRLSSLLLSQQAILYILFFRLLLMFPFKPLFHPFSTFINLHKILPIHSILDSLQTPIYQSINPFNLSNVILFKVEIVQFDVFLKVEAFHSL